MSQKLPIVPDTYDPKTVELCSFFDAVPGFLGGNDTPRDYLERCVEIITVREPRICAFVTIDIEAARLSACLLYTSPSPRD